MYVVRCNWNHMLWLVFIGTGFELHSVWMIWIMKIATVNQIQFIIAYVKPTYGFKAFVHSRRKITQFQVVQMMWEKSGSSTSVCQSFHKWIRIDGLSEKIHPAKRMTTNNSNDLHFRMNIYPVSTYRKMCKTKKTERNVQAPAKRMP